MNLPNSFSSTYQGLTVEEVKDWTNWKLLNFDVNLTLAGSVNLDETCTSASAQGDFIAAMRDVGNFRPEYTTIVFVACQNVHGDIIMVFRVTHTTLVSG